MIAAILYDLDGVIADTRVANEAAYAAAVTEFGLPWPATGLEGMAGLGGQELVARLCPTASHAQREAVLEAKTRLYPARLSSVRPNEPLIAMARSYQGRIPQALVSSSRRPNGWAVLHKLEIQDLFDVTVFRDDVVAPKPNPEGYWLAMERLGVSPERCLVFEDSALGVEAARRSGAVWLPVFDFG